ncbi:MAG TPA: rhodanese-like domain-containing protein [Ignavibacteriales bacterium]|nr:rhodanese-like domain-containing protein [Ignavibacteriales bacterium]
MPSGQIALYIFIALMVILYIRKRLKTRLLRQYNTNEIKEKLKGRTRDFVLLDVRTDAERADRHIKGSLHIPLSELSSRMDELKKVQDKEIICYCRSGNRSSTAALLLKDGGFRSANMKGGMLAWNNGR